jgi:hypothetical protein
MHVDSINALNAAILPILNGTVPFTSVEHVDKQHLDTHHEHVMDMYMMMEFEGITTSMDMMTEILWENVNLRLIVCIYLFSLTVQIVERFYIY